MDSALMTDDQRREHSHSLAHAYAQRFARLVVDALGGDVSAAAASILHRVAFELGHDACQTLAREIMARRTATGDDRPTVLITREQVECWAGRTLTDDEVSRLDDCIPNSTIPDAVGDIVESFGEDDGRDG